MPEVTDRGYFRRTSILPLVVSARRTAYGTLPGASPSNRVFDWTPPTSGKSLVMEPFVVRASMEYAASAANASLMEAFEVTKRLAAPLPTNR